jgi:predicted nucleotidyltransferase
MSDLVANGLSHAVDEIRAAQARVQAISLFGSRAGEHAGPLSDLDLALLSPAALGEVERWNLASRLSAVLHVEVDLVDLRRASAVMRVQVLGNSRLLFEGDALERMRFEMFALSDYARLNEERRGILDDVRAKGSVFG